jgi:hypothetical protein
VPTRSDFVDGVSLVVAFSFTSSLLCVQDLDGEEECHLGLWPWF